MTGGRDCLRIAAMAAPAPMRLRRRVALALKTLGQTFMNAIPLQRRCAAAIGCCAAALAGLLSGGHWASAHGFVGDRFFPPTMATDDPFAVDEFDLPAITGFDQPAGGGNPSSHQYTYGFEFDKEIFPHFAIGVSDDYVSHFGHGGPSEYGWDTVELTAKQELWTNDEHEAIISAGIIGDIGNSGSKQTDQNFSTIWPTLYVGKGFGDLPSSLDAVRPFAVTGEFSQTFPTSTASPDQFEWGFAVEYSMLYLHQNVDADAVPNILSDTVPLVEFAMSTNENRANAGDTTGTIDPGILIETPYFQIGAEALIPVNGATGPHVGFLLQTWIFIDDIFPQIFGHPIFGQD